MNKHYRIHHVSYACILLINPDSRDIVIFLDITSDISCAVSNVVVSSCWPYAVAACCRLLNFQRGGAGKLRVICFVGQLAARCLGTKIARCLRDRGPIGERMLHVQAHVCALVCVLFSCSHAVIGLRRFDKQAASCTFVLVPYRAHSNARKLYYLQ